MFEALKTSKDLQEYVRQQIRAELEEIAPSVFEKVKSQLALAEKSENLHVSWHLENNRLEQSELLQEQQVLHKSIHKAIEEQM